jgi:ABC-type polysaccharide/polyol phosphate export permease
MASRAEQGRRASLSTAASHIMLDLLTVCSFVRYKRVFWYTRIITDGTSSVTSGKKMILDVKLGRNYFIGAVSNKEFSHIVLLNMVLVVGTFIFTSNLIGNEISLIIINID